MKLSRHERTQRKQARRRARAAHKRAEQDAVHALSAGQIQQECVNLRAKVQRLENSLHNQRAAIGALRRKLEIAKDPELSRRQVAAARRQLKAQAPVPGMTAAEANFAEKARQRGWELYRHGWPDFLAYDRSALTPFFVEVKGPGDSLAASQTRMFAFLEELGIQVRIFRPHVPGSLIHWRKYQDPTQDRRNRGGSHLLESGSAPIERAPESTGGTPWSAYGPEAEGSGRIH